MVATANLKDELIEAAAQSVLAPFNINTRFYNDIIKKVKTFTKKFDKTKYSKDLQESVATSLTSLATPFLPTTKLPINKKDNTSTNETNAEQTGLFNSLLKNFKEVLKPAQKEKDYFAEAQPIFLQGIAPEVYTQLKKVVNDLLPTTNKRKKEDKDSEKGAYEKYKEGGLLGLLPKALLPVLGGATLILGGLAALVGGFMTQGPAKGALELIGKAGLQGGLKIVAKKIFTKSLEKVLTKIPIIGSLISFGFAIQRFMNGDVTGGFLSLAAGLVNLIPGVGFVLGIGIDVLQTILDAKAGGSSAEASAKKTDILKNWASKIGSLIWKGLRYAPIIGPLFDVYDSYQKGDWAGVAINLLRSVGQMSGVFYVIDLIDTLTGGNLRSMAKEGTATTGDWIGKMSVWLYKSAKNWPIIGRLIKVGEAIGTNNWTEALTQFTRLIPGTGWLLDWLGATEEKQTQFYQQGGNPLNDLWEWMSTTMWEKVTGVVGSLTDTVKNWWDNLSWDPKTWFGKSPDVSNILEPSLDSPTSVAAKKPVPMATGGIITEPTNTIIGEAGPEAVIPLNKFFDGDSFGLSNKTLEQIAGHTGSTSGNVKNLTNAIFALANTIGSTQSTNAGPNVAVINNQQPQTPSASQVAEANIDAIRRIRQQFQFA